MVWNCVLGIVLNIITLILLTQFAYIPSLGSPVIPIMYFLGIIQTTGQNLLNTKMDEAKRLKSVSKRPFDNQ
jgi:hypothetical protein